MWAREWFETVRNVVIHREFMRERVERMRASVEGGAVRNDGTVERRRYVPERTCKFKPFKTQRSDLLSEGVCSECSGYMHSEMLYCPNCGAKVVDE